MANSQNGPPSPYTTGGHRMVLLSAQMSHCNKSYVKSIIYVCYVHDRDSEDTYGAEGPFLDGQVVLGFLLVLQRNHSLTAHMDNEASCRRCTDTHHSDPRCIPAALQLTEGAASATQPVNHTTLDPHNASVVADEADSVALLQVLLKTEEFQWIGVEQDLRGGNVRRRCVPYTVRTATN